MRKVFIILVFFLAIGLLIFSFSELETIGQTLQRSNLLYVGIALVVELLWLLNIALTFQALYRVMGFTEKLHHMVLTVAAVNFVNVVAPTAGVGGMAVIVDDGNKRGHPPGRVAAASVLFLLLDYLAFMLVLALGLMVLIRRNDLEPGEIVASIIIVFIATLLGVLLYIGSKSADQLGSILGWMGKQVNRVTRFFTKRDYLNETRAYTFASEIAEGLAELREHPQSLIFPMLLSVTNKGLLISILLLVFLAFSVPYSAGTIIAGFAIGYLFLIVSPTPSGVGVVEGALALALKSLRVDWSQAVIITLVYRAITFWFQLAVGAIAFRVLQRQLQVADQNNQVMH